MTSTATASGVPRDRRSVRPYTACERSPVASVPGYRCCLSGMPGLQSLYQSQRDWAKPGHRAARRSATSPSLLDVHLSSQRSLRAEKATGRTGLRNHQRSNRGYGGSCCAASPTWRPSGSCCPPPSTCALSVGCGAPHAASAIRFTVRSLVPVS